MTVNLETTLRTPPANMVSVSSTLWCHTNSHANRLPTTLTTLPTAKPTPTGRIQRSQLSSRTSSDGRWAVTEPSLNALVMLFSKTSKDGQLLLQCFWSFICIDRPIPDRILTIYGCNHFDDSTLHGLLLNRIHRCLLQNHLHELYQVKKS